MSEWVEIGSLADLEASGRLVARIGGREVGVVRDPVTGELHGFRNRCPHSGAPLCLGRVRTREEGEPGTYAPSGERVLRCPWHGWEFDLATGGCLDDETIRAAVYPVEAVDGVVRISA